ncbi:hypothetical protein O181_118812 [Austropuccinia psidii MF-1]|uniref:Uncharacterized protein n=1 Tax=Austropuccinia psidii MF-1 TaxID=1389203 RepID=A0A9Q3Q0S1_9BASI|nr:hypothetical protein [Austropuccinia psidii MF-1]
MSSLTHPYASAPLPLNILSLPQHPQDTHPMPAPHLPAQPSSCFHTSATYHAYAQDMPLMLPPHVSPHPSLRFRTPAAYNAYAPAALSRYASNTGTSSYAHPSLGFRTPIAYHAYSPAAPSRYASDSATPCPPSVRFDYEKRSKYYKYLTYCTLNVLMNNE